MKTVLAGDLGGTKCRFALVAEDCSIHQVAQVATVRERATFLQQLQQSLAGIRAAVPAGLQPPLAIGVGTAGVILPGGRTIHSAPNLPLDGVALADLLQAEFQLPAVLLNDGRASAWGEFLRGRARGEDPLLCLFFGTGIGIGLMLGGKPYGGGNDAAGEIGHTIFAPGGRRCPCGGAGHFEAYCGGRAITERAAAEIGPPPDRGGWTVGQVVQNGGAAAARILQEAEAAATAMVANLCTLLNPRAVVLGGGVLLGWPALASRLEAATRAACSPPITDRLAFVPSLDGADAILLGAAAATGMLWQR